jgi:hypothetical protein
LTFKIESSSRLDYVEESLQRRVGVFRLPACDVSKACRAIAMMEWSEGDAEAGKPDSGFTLERDALAVRDLAEQAFAAETPCDDLRMVGGRGKVAK